MPFLAELVIMAASTLMFFFGTSFGVIVVARVLQGSAAAFVGQPDLHISMVESLNTDRNYRDLD